MPHLTNILYLTFTTCQEIDQTSNVTVELVINNKRLSGDCAGERGCLINVYTSITVLTTAIILDPIYLKIAISKPIVTFCLKNLSIEDVKRLTYITVY